MKSEKRTMTRERQQRIREIALEYGIDTLTIDDSDDDRCLFDSDAEYNKYENDCIRFCCYLVADREDEIPESIKKELLDVKARREKKNKETIQLTRLALTR